MPAPLPLHRDCPGIPKRRRESMYDGGHVVPLYRRDGGYEPRSAQNAYFGRDNRRWVFAGAFCEDCAAFGPDQRAIPAGAH